MSSVAELLGAEGGVGGRLNLPQGTHLLIRAEKLFSYVAIRTTEFLKEQ